MPVIMTTLVAIGLQAAALVLRRRRGSKPRRVGTIAAAPASRGGDVPGWPPLDGGRLPDREASPRRAA